MADSRVKQGASVSKLQKFIISTTIIWTAYLMQGYFQEQFQVDFRYLPILNLFQSIFIVLQIEIQFRLFNQRTFEQSWKNAFLFFTPSITNVVGPTLGALSLSNITYPVQVLLKTCKLLAVVVLRTIVFRQLLPAIDYLCALSIVMGLYLFSLDKSKLTSKNLPSPNPFLGYTFCFLNLIFDGITNSLQDYTKSREFRSNKIDDHGSNNDHRFNSDHGSNNNGSRIGSRGGYEGKDVEQNHGSGNGYRKDASSYQVHQASQQGPTQLKGGKRNGSVVAQKGHLKDLLMYYMNFWQLVLLLCVSSYGSFRPSNNKILQQFNLVAALQVLNQKPILYLHITLYCVLGLIGQQGIFGMLAEFDGIILVFTTTTRKFFSILMSSLIFGHMLSSTQIFGALIVFSSVLARSYFSTSKRTKGH